MDPVGVQYTDEALLRRIVGLYPLPDAVQVPSDTRSGHRHVTVGVPTRAMRTPRAGLQLQIVRSSLLSSNAEQREGNGRLTRRRWRKLCSTPIEILWAFSIYLEAVAILPQLFMLQRTGEADSITSHYLFALGLYRGMYIPNWIYRCAANPFSKSPVNGDPKLIWLGWYTDTSRKTRWIPSPSAPD